MTEPIRSPTWRRGTTRSIGGQAASALLLTNMREGETLIYIGVIQENIDESLMKLNMLTGKRRQKPNDE